MGVNESMKIPVNNSSFRLKPEAHCDIVGNLQQKTDKYLPEA
jgi:hypothetical protein